MGKKDDKVEEKILQSLQIKTGFPGNSPAESDKEGTGPGKEVTSDLNSSSSPPDQKSQSYP